MMTAETQAKEGMRDEKRWFGWRWRYVGDGEREWGGERER